jgi:hypothetical protein
MMTRRTFLIALLQVMLLVLLASCQGPESATPTPFQGGAATIAPPPATPIGVELLRLVTDPANFENAYLQVAGNYRSLPVLACGAAPRRPPASWALEDGEVYVQAAGYDTLLAAVAPQGLPMEVVGQWRRWRGPVGCGKEADITEIWYLDVTRILSPNPIAYSTADPVTIVEVIPTPTPEGGIGGGPLPAGTPIPLQTNTPPAGVTLPSGSPTLPSLLPSATSTRPATSAAATTAAPTLPGIQPTASQTPAAGQATPTVTTGALTGTPPTPGTPGATATSPAGGTPTVAPTTLATVPAGTVVDQGTMEYEDIVKGQIVAGASHRWLFNGNSGDTVFIQAIAATGSNAVLTLRDPQGNPLVNNQNTASADQPEVIADYVLPMSGEFEIIVGNVANAATGYALAIYDANSYPVVFMANLKYGDLLNGSLPSDTDHYWFFSGTAGETITIRVAPSDTSDPFFSLIGPDMTTLVDFVDEKGAGEAEELLGFQLPTTGYYSILVAEGFFAASNYTINLTRQ